jgi:hypothetical protein
MKVIIWMLCALNDWFFFSSIYCYICQKGYFCIFWHHFGIYQRLPFIAYFWLLHNIILINAFFKIYLEVSVNLEVCCFKYLSAIIDLFHKYPLAVPLKNKTMTCDWSFDYKISEGRKKSTEFMDGWKKFFTWNLWRVFLSLNHTSPMDVLLIWNSRCKSHQQFDL